MAEAASSDSVAALRRAVQTITDALRTLEAVDSLEEQAALTISSVLDEPDLISAAFDSVRGARESLHRARACAESALEQASRSEGPAANARAWAEEIVRLHRTFGDAMTQAMQLETEAYDRLRSSLLEIFVANETKRPRWEETWTFDAESARAVSQRLPSDGPGLLFGGLDRQLAWLRWEVGWSQMRIAEVVGVSQPTVAARLSRIEMFINQEVAREHIGKHAARDGFSLSAPTAADGTRPRDATFSLELRRDDCTVRLETQVVAGETGTSRRGAAGERGPGLDLFRLEQADVRQQQGRQLVQGIAVYFRDRGVVGYYTVADLLEQGRRLRRTTGSNWLAVLRAATEPAWTLSELLERAASHQ